MQTGGVAAPTCNESKKFNMTSQYQEDIMQPWTTYELEILGSARYYSFPPPSFTINFYEGAAYPQDGMPVNDLSGLSITTLNYDCENAPL